MIAFYCNCSYFHGSLSSCTFVSSFTDMKNYFNINENYKSVYIKTFCADKLIIF